MILKNLTETPERRQNRLTAFFESRRPVREALEANKAERDRARAIFLEDCELGIEPGIRLAAYNARIRVATVKMTAALKAFHEARSEGGLIRAMMKEEMAWYLASVGNAIYGYQVLGRFFRLDYSPGSKKGEPWE